jgi:hypothetical protein
MWHISNLVDLILVTCHGDLLWVQLKCFVMDEMDSCVSEVDDIESSLVQRVAYCQDMIMYEVFDLGG